MDITPINIWKDGQQMTATQFVMKSILDDLETKATFYYELKTNDDKMVSDGNLQLKEEEYSSWDGTNAWAYEWAITKLSL